jgi:hypothetical protein
MHEVGTFPLEVLDEISEDLPGRRATLVENHRPDSLPTKNLRQASFMQQDSRELEIRDIQ